MHVDRPSGPQKGYNFLLIWTDGLGQIKFISFPSHFQILFLSHSVLYFMKSQNYNKKNSSIRKEHFQMQI